MQTLLKVENLKKRYGKTTILENVNFTINKNEIIAINGENGSGKSTLLKLLAGINTPTSGKIMHTITSLNVGLVPDKFPEDTPFSIEEYMHFLGKVNGLSKMYIKKTLENQLENFHLINYRNKKIETFSKGMKQKVNILQGLLNKPDVLILDEPLTGLDGSAQEEIKHIIKSLHESGVSIIFTSHEEKLMKTVATRILTIDKGVISNEIHRTSHLNVKISFDISISSAHDYLKNSNDVKILQHDVGFYCITVRNEKSDEYLRWILHHGGHVTEVIKIT